MDNMAAGLDGDREPPKIPLHPSADQPSTLESDFGRPITQQDAN